RLAVTPAEAGAQPECARNVTPAEAGAQPECARAVSRPPALALFGHGKALRRIYPGFAAQWHPLRRGNVESSKAHRGAPRRPCRGFHEGAQREATGLARGSRGRDRCDHPREADQEMESALETEADRGDESGVEGSVRGSLQMKTALARFGWAPA